jgi:hypothetical protein
VSYSPQSYRDWPLIDGRNITKGRSWSKSQDEHDRGIEADPGDVIEVFIYYQNGGITEDCEEGNALHVTIEGEVTPSIGQSSLLHKLSGVIKASNASSVSSSDPGKGGDLRVNVHGGVPQTLSLVPGTVEERHPNTANPKDAPYHLLDSIFEEGVDLGTIRTGPNVAGFVIFQVKVSAK